jgi:OOP family OmpA-OmpF porin
MATYECDPDLLPKPEKRVAAPEPAPAPAPTPAPAPITEPEKLSLSADTLFDFDKANLKSEGKQALDDLVNKLGGVKYDTVVVIGYADRLGSDAYNKKLSMRRAEAVKTYLVNEKGIAADKVFTDGKGEANPVTGDSCKGNKRSKALIACLQPDRRVEVEIAGTRETVQ